jgi:12,18-didecarboxysiroheme deacetylase
VIGISKLYCGTVEASDPLRYGRKAKQLPSHLLQFSQDKKPIVVWNTTRRCNLSCVHCYSQSANRCYPDELTTEQGLELLDDLGEFGAPVVLFSGGEPLMREDLLTLIAHAKKVGLRAVISTNGTLIDQQKAERFAELGLSYVGVSLDGMRETNDKFRHHEGAFDQAIRGIRFCQKAGVKVGLRFTINKRNVQDVADIFQLLIDEEIPRVCFYHLVYAGRGTNLMDEDLNLEETRQVVDLIIDKTAAMYAQGMQKEVLTVDNHTDGPYLYMRMLRENNERAAEVMKLLKMNGGNSTGIGIGCVSWDGQVHADQFWRHHTFGNVKERKFSEIWTDTSEPLMGKLKDRKAYLQGRCATCRFQDVCNGNFRVRAEAATGDLWEPDPACYLTDDEISPDE